MRKRDRSKVAGASGGAATTAPKRSRPLGSSSSSNLQSSDDSSLQVHRTFADVMDPSLEDIEEALLYTTFAACLQEYLDSMIYNQPVNDSKMQGHAWLKEMLEKQSPVRCRELLRMQKDVFFKLSNALRERNLLRDTRYISVEEQLAMFLITIGHNHSNFIIKDRFKHSGETVSRHFHNVLEALAKFAKEIIVPPSFNETPSQFCKNQKYMPWFKDCIGAIDGTHVSAVIPVAKQVPYRSGRKGNVTQNVMAVCSFDMQFTWIWPGWEGSAHDQWIMEEAISTPRLKFPHAPPGKYYLVDAGYQNTPGFLAPFQGERYHLLDFRHGGGRPKGKKEIFNHAHSSLRNVIERCFGALKARFPILKMMPSYAFRTQVLLVVAACTIHNFIRRETTMDWLFEKYGDNDVIVIDSDDEDEDKDEELDMDSIVVPEQNNAMDQFRETLANEMEEHLGC